MTIFSLLAVVPDIDRLDDAMSKFDHRELERDRSHLHEPTGDDTSCYYVKTSNPRAMFDSAVVGGDWSRCFKPYDPAHPSLVRADSSRCRRIKEEAKKVPDFRRTWVAGGPKGQLDIAGTRDAMAAEGARRWKEFAIGRPECGGRTWRFRAVPRYALLTLEGEWIEPEPEFSFGFAALSDHHIAYLDHVNHYIDSLPDEVYLVTVECHR